jgi:hypothetical protein
MKIIFHLILLSFLNSCSSIKPNQSGIEITTTTPATVFYKDQQSEKLVTLGPTPYKISFEELKELSNNSFWNYLIVEAEGYVPEHLILPKEGKSSQKIQLNLKRVEWWNDPSQVLSSKVVQQIGKNFQEIYRSIRQGKNKEALELTDQLIKEYSQASILYDIKGSLHLIEGAREKAISAYERSLQLSYDNAETIKILDQLKKSEIKR